MLANDRFNWETPNVIDPGEQPPGRPDRPEDLRSPPPTSKSFEKTTIGYSNPAKPYLSSNRIKISLDSGSSFHSKNSQSSHNSLRDVDMGDPEDDDDDLEDGLPGSGDQLPSVEQARMFAATILKESEYRKSRRNLMAGESSPLSYSLKKGSPHDDEGEYEYQIKTNDWAYSRKRMILRIICGMLGIAAIVFFVAMVVIFVRDRDGNNDPVWTARMQKAVEFLTEGSISDPDALLDSSSPQHKAADWISNHDAIRISIPTEVTAAEYFIQRYVLAVFFFALKGDEWTNSNNFLSQDHECSWFRSVKDENNEVFAVGVTCNSELHATNILLPDNNLVGEIPDEVRWLSQLRLLDLKHNWIAGGLPLQLEALSSLEYLDLKFNSFTGTIISSIGTLTNLGVLGLSNNKLRGTLPKEMSRLSNLISLELDDNLLTGSVKVLSQLTNLVYLYMNGNALTGSLDTLGMFDSLPNLIEADWSENQLSSTTFPVGALNHPSLEYLDLSGNLLDGVFPDTLEVNTALKFLSLRQNLLSGDVSSDIQHLSSLKHLDLEFNELSGELPAAIGTLSHLNYLFLGNNGWTEGPIPDEYQNLSHLHELALDVSMRTGEVPSWITSFRKLKLLNLAYNDLTGQIPTGLGHLEHLAFLVLNDNSLTGEVPTDLGTSPQSILTVSLHHTGLSGDVDALCSMQPELLTTDCDQITCSCCETCCDSEDCYEDLIWNNLEFWEASGEEHFQRSDYSFNPHILSDVGKVTLDAKDRQGE